jgi:hypothetical protein
MGMRRLPQEVRQRRARLHTLFRDMTRQSGTVKEDTKVTHAALTQGKPVDLVAAGQRFQAQLQVRC